jgi:multidrug efflux system outer membrane protein
MAARRALRRMSTTFAKRPTKQTPHLPQPGSLRRGATTSWGRAISGRFVVAPPSKVTYLASESRLESPPKIGASQAAGLVQSFPRRLAPLALSLVLAGCATMEPPVPEARPDIPLQWPIPATTRTGDGPAVQTAKPGAVPADAVADIGWRDFFVDPALEDVIAKALEGNRDLRVAMLNVERARQLYRVQRAARLPIVSGGLEMVRSGDDPRVEDYSASVGVTGFELDLWGRVRSLSDAALRQFFATEEARRAAQLSLIAEVANAWLTLAADRELLKVALATLKSQEASFGLAQKRYELGAVSRLDFAQARTQVEAARADVARFEGQVARDSNALQLLAGSPIDAAALPGGFDRPQVAGLAAVPAGLPSEVLLRRPDVRQAEQLLRSANADVGAARAAFFPSITLTAGIGTASTDLASLFGSGSFAWSFIPRVNIPIFPAGRLTSNLEREKVERDIALAQYERAIQAGFREVADALALSRTLAAQREAQEASLAAAADASRLSEERYKAGRDSYLALLDAQRTFYAAQQALVATRLQEQANRVALYKALGGGWKERG